MNLHSIVGPIVGAVNPNIPVSIRVSTGNTKAADFTTVPTYADPVTVIGQLQPLTAGDLRQIEGLNLSGTKKAIYLNGAIESVVRSTNQGGDLITLPDGSVWLVVMVLEGFDPTAGWCKAAIVLQNGS